ncbi:response regulator transcription factor [Ginsengibacter hankyongi]|uniref:Response regulator transcription factor n=1 Tax=Ginsengibacter hankyongi TaxID=2607284 RepID=A0A5J5ID28_9BACT|nr:LytTR family DNA-binding domain-containing protein [Ginsengibacter hankyongi]KAA9037260.1 response regulator transcription factor [Ginsengibacter hankyongi]
MINKKIMCLAVDDEPLALSVLKKYINSVDSLELVGSCANAVQALQMLQQHHVDMIFLDIQMPQIMGTDFIRTLKKSPEIIFTTAYRKYAVEGFELDAVDYLLKPISFERFLKAVNKVFQTDIVAPESVYQTNELISETSAPWLYVRADRKMIKVLLNDILYIEALSDYVKIITSSKTIVTKQLISTLEETLTKDNFIRIHRSFIIAINKIDSYNADSIQVGSKELPVSRLFKQNVNKLLNISSLPSSNDNKGIKKKA